jgi:hypothetical protein
MTDLRRELHLLITIAKLDAQLNACRNESGQLPEKIEKIDRNVKAIEKAVSEASAHLEAIKKERRLLEQKLQDSAEKVKKLKVQLMEIKTNKEYQAMLHEIGHTEKDIDENEERLLMLMDELDQQGLETGGFTKQKDEERQRLSAERASLEARLQHLGEDTKRLEGEKPKILAELDPQIKRRYDRILAKLHDFAVTHVVDDVCQGCHSRIPPQAALEVKRNDQIIACQACGRILVHYPT